MPSDSLTLRCTSAIWTSRFTCCELDTEILLITEAFAGRADFVNCNARSAASADATSPLSSAPWPDWRTRTSRSSPSPDRADRTGSMSSATVTFHRPTRAPSFPRAATEVRPTALPNTNSTCDETTCTSAVAGLATNTEPTGLASRIIRLWPT